MNKYLQKSTLKPSSTVLNITGSKSESNRLLILQALYSNITIHNLAYCDDVVVMQNAMASSSDVMDVHHAGTAMRFLTAFYSCQEGEEVILTGSNRMQERPIGVLVDALRLLGADIEYLANEGYPPLKIKGKELNGGEIAIQANVSSQFISALLLVAPKLKSGLKLHLEGEITSIPYINMTLSLLNKLGITTCFDNTTIHVMPKPSVMPIALTVESDWSAVSYYYSMIALSPIGTKIKLASYFKNSIQGDKKIAEIYAYLGVQTVFDTGVITLEKQTTHHVSKLSCNLQQTPDVAQTIAVTCFGLGIDAHLTGLHTLKIKETDRLKALQNELQKLGATVHITDDAIDVKSVAQIKEQVEIATYQDHRMAMAFAPLALKVPITISDAEVVSKSYPKFWEDIERLGVKTK